jgi:hypothetical protein
MMICNSVRKCGITDKETCYVCAPHDPCKSTGLSMCWRINGLVRCIPHRSYDAEGRAARLQAIRFLRRSRTWTYKLRLPRMNGLRAAYRDILLTMRDARKGAK